MIKSGSRRHARRFTAAAALSCLSLILLGVFCLGISAQTYPESENRDGFIASAHLKQNENGGYTAVFGINNKTCEFADLFSVTVRTDGGLKILPAEKGTDETVKTAADGDTADFSLSAAAGEKKEVSLVLSLPPTEDTAPDEETSSADTDAAVSGGCSASVCSAAGIFLIVAAAAAVITGSASEKGRGLRFTAFAAALLILCGGTVSPAIGAAAEASERSFTVASSETADENTVTVFFDVKYVYDYTEKEVAKTTGMKQFDITFFFGPRGNDILDENVIADIAAAGFTSVPVDVCTAEVNKQALTLLKKHGLTCFSLWDSRIVSMIGSPVPPADDVIDATVKEVVEDYAEFDNINGWYLIDEPSAAKFTILGKITAAFKKYDPDRNVYINLFPNYASSAQLGAKSYEKYLEMFIEKVDPSYLSYDYYEFMKTKTRKGFFSNMEPVRKFGQKYGRDQMCIILLTEHLSYADVTYEQIRWQANMCLAYGMRGISYFTYWLDDSLLSQGWTNSCVNNRGEKYQHYYDVQKVNADIKVLGDQLFDKRSAQVFHISGGGVSIQAGSQSYRGYGDLGPVDAKGFCIGFFDDGSFMIVNENYRAGETGKNALTTKDFTCGMEVFDVTEAKWISAGNDGRFSRTDDGNWSLILSGGEGVLCRRAKD